MNLKTITSAYSFKDAKGVYTTTSIIVNLVFIFITIIIIVGVSLMIIGALSGTNIGRVGSVFHVLGNK